MTTTWTVAARERTDDRRGGHYSRRVVLVRTAPDLVDLWKGHHVQSGPDISAPFAAALRAAPPPVGVCSFSSIEVGRGWRQDEVVVAYSVNSVKPSLILNEAEAAAHAREVAIPIVEPLIAAAVALGRERARRELARQQASDVVDRLARQIAKQAHGAVGWDARLAALKAEAAASAELMAEHIGLADLGNIEPEAAAWVRRTLVERASAEARSVGGGFRIPATLPPESELFPGSEP